MAQCKMAERSIDDKAKVHNLIVKIKNGMVKAIKNSDMEGDAKVLLDMALKENNIEESLDASQTSQPVNAKADKYDTKFDVFDIERVKSGYKVLYITPERKSARVVTVSSIGEVDGMKSVFNIEELNNAYRNINQEKIKNKVVQKLENEQITLQKEGAGLDTIFDEVLNKKLQDILKKLYPNINLEYTTEDIAYAENVLNQETTDNSIKFKLKVIEGLNSLATIRSNIRLNTKDKPYIEKNLSKALLGRGVPQNQIDLIFEYMRQNGIEEISTKDLAEKMMLDLTSTVEVKTIAMKPTTEQLNKYNYLEAKGDIESLAKLDIEIAKTTSTDYYKDITVEGGINYREVEISTPGLVAPKKGHADFATSEGIGWYRVDDTIENNDATLRILEMQSDMFQKMKDKKLDSPINVENVEKRINTHKKELSNEKAALHEQEAELFDDSFKNNQEKEDFQGEVEDTRNEIKWLEDKIISDKELIRNNKTTLNKSFLQILNTKNKWVKFFVQSIIQDAQKNGYRNIRFPSGETVAKVEGHQSFAEEIEAINTKENINNREIKENKRILKNKKENITEYNYNNFKKYLLEDKKHLLQNVNNSKGKDSYPAKTLQKIINYINTKKQEEVEKKFNSEYAIYRRNIKDSREISKLELEIKELNDYSKILINEKKNMKAQGIEKLKPIEAFYQNRVRNTLVNTYGKENIKTVTDEHGNSWFELIIQNKRDSDIIMLQEEQGRIKGQANIEARTVLINSLLQSQDTLPHEYAHHYIAMFRDAPIVQEAIKKWGSEEKLVQAIGEQVVAQKGEAYNWFKKFTHWIQEKFNRLDKKTKDELKNILTDAFLTNENLNNQEKPKMLKATEKEVMEFGSSSGSKITFTKENSDVIDAELINDMGKAEEVFNLLIESDGIKLEDDHKTLLLDTLRNLTDMNKKIIPDMITVISGQVEENVGSMVMKGPKKGIYVGVSGGIQNARNAMSAAEMYVHELKHASLEFAQRDKREVITNAMNDIQEIYETFMNTVTEEDFMPPLSESINRTLERQNAKDVIAYMSRPDVGLNEFIVRAETNMVVKKVLTERVTVKKEKKAADTLWKRLIGLIQTVYDGVYGYIRGNDKNLDGATAMAKYIAEISKVNNVTLDELARRNVLISNTVALLDFFNIKGSDFIKKMIAKMQVDVGTKEGKAFEQELHDFVAKGKDNTALDKMKFAGKMGARWLSTKDISAVGSFETWLEFGLGKMFSGLGLETLKPEGDIQQLIRGFRQSDSQETLVEKFGLMASKIEYQIETLTTQQSILISELFDDKLSEKDSITLTKGAIDIELDGLIDEQLDGTEKEKWDQVVNVMQNKDALAEDIRVTKEMIRLAIGDERRSNFMINQAEGLGKYMITGEAGNGQMMNSYMIYGTSSLNLEKDNIVNENDKPNGKFRRALIDKLATLYAIENNDDVINNNTAEIIKANPYAMVGLMKYDTMIRREFKKYEGKENEYDLTRVKGQHQKINANWITYRVGMKEDAEKMAKEDYLPVEGVTHSDKYVVYFNTNYTESGWASEGVRMTNDGQSINSFVNIVKDDISEMDDPFNDEALKESAAKIRKILKEKSKETMRELIKMREDKYSAGSTDMRPVFAIGKDGKMFVTDMDITVQKNKMEELMHSKNKVETVLGKTFARASDIHFSRENNIKILDAIEHDANENYNVDREGITAGKKNLMTYIRIGSHETNAKSKEIWGVLPRYFKVEIFRRHFRNKVRDMADIAKDLGLSEDSIWSDKAKKTQDALQAEYKNENTNLEKLLMLNRRLFTELSSNMNTLIEKKVDDKKYDEIREKINTIKKSNPYIAVRRNLLYHYFGNREATLLNMDNTSSFSRITRILKQIDMLWKHIVKVVKVNIVIRGLDVLLFNIISNVLLAVIQGKNPFEEIRNQMQGVMNLQKYREDIKMIEKLKMKMKAGTATAEDKKNLNLHISSLNRNPAKPLIDAGLYTSATEDISNDDLHKETFIDNFVNKYAGKVPGGVRDVIDVLYITKRTSLFNSLLLAMQYGDFGARYSKYYTLINQGWSKEKAIKEVLDNQINYNFKHGKIIQWLNARGFAMFTKFFEAIQRVIKKTTIEKPANVLMAVLSGGFMFEDSPFGDSLFARDIGDSFHNPLDILGVLAERPALLQILTGKY